MMNSPTYGSDPASPNTTYVQADPSTFRAVVQKLTGAPEDPSTQKLPLTLPSRYTTPKPTAEMGPRRPAFKLHERRQSTKKLHLNLNLNTTSATSTTAATSSPSGPSSLCGPGLVCSPRGGGGFVGFGSEMVMVSPVSPLEFLARGSPSTPVSPCQADQKEEERVIAEKGFFLHPSPLSTPRGSDPPELLPLFPLHSPRENSQKSQNSS